MTASTLIGRAAGGKLTLAACAAAVIGSLLPWASAFGYRVYGVEGDGLITLLLALAAAALTVMGRRWPPAVLGAAIAAIAVADVSRLVRFADAGLYVTLLAGVGVAAFRVASR